MLRDIDQLTARTFDLLVVGGGVYGLIVAYDAAQRGLSVALVERGDFGGGTSFNHHRTIHGGLRYLQTLDLGRARESILERRTFARIAASAVRALPFVLPLDSSLARGPLAMRAGFAIDRIVGHDRNADVPDTHRLPTGEVLGRDQAIARFPVLRGVPMSGAAVWHDYVTTDAERLTIAWLTAATSHGAVAANYVEAGALTIAQGRVTGVQAVDRLTGDALQIHAHIVVNATGGGVDRLLAPPMVETRLPMIRAMNLVTRRQALSYGLGGRAASGRNLLAVPYHGRLVVGTWESGRQVSAGDTGVSSEEVGGFMREINEAFPYFKLTRNDVTLVHQGVVPGLKRPDGSFALEGRDQLHDHALSGLAGLISVVGTKYTTARRVAERAVDLVVEKLGRTALPCRTAILPLPVTLLSGDEGLTHAAREEMVETLEDVVLRRVPLGQAGDPDDAAITHAASVVGGVLGWNLERRLDEAARVRAVYGSVNALIT